VEGFSGVSRSVVPKQRSLNHT